MYSFSVSKSISATGTSTTTSQDSQSDAADGQRPRSSFMGLSTTAHTLTSALTPATDYQQDELGLLTEIGTIKISPLEAVATHPTVTSNDDYQGRSASSLSLSNGPSRSQKLSQRVEDVAPIVREELITDPTGKWIMMSGSKKRPFQCGHRGCGRKYSKEEYLRTHFVTHTGDSKLRCYLGKCAGIVIYPKTQALTRHVHVHHSFERMFDCKICHRRFRLQHHLKRHKENVHFIKSKKKSPKQQSVSESSATTTTHTASTGTLTSGNSQPESAAGQQRQQGSFTDLQTPVHTPESTRVPLAEQAFAGLRLLAEASASQVDPFEALAAHRTVTFDNDHQKQPDNSSSQSGGSLAIIGESSLPIVDAAPTVREAPLKIIVSVLPTKDAGDNSIRTITTIPKQELWRSINDHFQRTLSGTTSKAMPSAGIAGVPNLPSFQHLAKPSPDPTDTNKWIIVDNSQERPYRCGYPRCDKSYIRKDHLIRHFLLHTGTSSFRCHYPECVGKEYFRDSSTLKRHMVIHTSEKPFQCDLCERRFGRKDHLRGHRNHRHGNEEKKKSPKRKKK